MGPGPDGPGKHRLVKEMIDGGYLLQWGRGRMAPENWRQVMLILPRHARFNGAGAGWPRKTAALVPDGGGMAIASMGPGPDGPGKR